MTLFAVTCITGDEPYDHIDHYYLIEANTKEQALDYAIKKYNPNFKLIVSEPEIHKAYLHRMK